MENSQENTTFILADVKVFDFLKEKAGDRKTKTEAYWDLLDRSMAGFVSPFVRKVERKLLPNQCHVTISDLAEFWHWHRATVRTFLDALESFGLLERTKLNKSVIITMTVQSGKNAIAGTEQDEPDFATRIGSILSEWVIGKKTSEDAGHSCILNQYLVEFMAAKRMDLICCCQSEIEFDLGAIDLPFEIECTNGKFKDISPNAKSNYQICISPHFAKIQSWFNGKIIFNHESLKSIIERMKTSVNYIIGTDVNGAPIASTVATDPYTPVFFDKKVQAYYNYQGCRIEELRIISPNFTLRCDNDHNDYVVVFLRDIQDLPYREQCIWKGFNITPDGRTFSKLFQKTIIEGKWNGVAQSIDFVFRDLYKTFVAKWEEKYGWKLFKSLNGIQAEYFNQICILNRDDYEALTDLVKYLSLLLQESLDLEMMEMIIPAKTEIKEKVVNGEKTKESTKEKPLSHLDRILETLNIEGYNFIVFLRNLQSLRSYMLHRNSKKLDKDKKRAFEYFGLNEDKSNSQSVSNNVLSLGATAISNMIKQL